MTPEKLISILLCCVTFVCYFKVKDYDFINLDDPMYVAENEFVQQGFTSDSIKWAFSFPDRAYWHPVTWLSHMLDIELFGLSPGWHHLINVCFHIANTIMLFYFLNFTTKELWKSFFVAVWFALHPINVESVAWIAERKNVLSTFFWMTSLWLYIRFIRQPLFINYLILILSFIVGLLAKPMVVTLPFILLLLDYWPLNRITYPLITSGNLKIVGEKIPLILISICYAIITSMSVNRPQVLLPIEVIPMFLRIENAVVSYALYISKLFVPYPLAIFYPFPSHIPIWKVVCSAFLLMMFTGIFMYLKKSRYLIVGWLWYLGTLFPVIGFKQAGLWPAFADRWAYMPFIGLYIIIAWGGSKLMAHYKFPIVSMPLVAGISTVLLFVGTINQIRTWKDSVSLYQHAIDKGIVSSLVYGNLGIELTRHGKFDQALFYLNKAVNADFEIIVPPKDNYTFAIGFILFSRHQLEEAISFFKKTVALNPSHMDAHIYLASAYVSLDKIPEAIRQYQKAIELNSNDWRVHNDFGSLLADQGYYEDAIKHFKESLRLNPNNEPAKINLDIAQKAQKNK